MIAGIIENAGQVGQVKLTRLAGTQAGDIFIGAAEGSSDDFDSCFCGLGI